MVKTDPITFATDEIGRYAVHVNANDVATMGAVPPAGSWPHYFCLRAGTDEALVRSVFESLRRAAGEIDVSLCGGHTEITSGSGPADRRRADAG